MGRMDLIERDSAAYEPARAATCWNARTPERYPDLVVQAQSERDVVAAVRHARDNGLRVGVRSGGHSWAGNHVRDGGLLLDVSRLKEVTIDPETMTATAGFSCAPSVSRLTVNCWPIAAPSLL